MNEPSGSCGLMDYTSAIGKMYSIGLLGLSNYKHQWATSRRDPFWDESSLTAKFYKALRDLF